MYRADGRHREQLGTRPRRSMRALVHRDRCQGMQQLLVVAAIRKAMLVKLPHQCGIEISPVEVGLEQLCSGGSWLVHRFAPNLAQPGTEIGSQSYHVGSQFADGGRDL